MLSGLHKSAFVLRAVLMPVRVSGVLIIQYASAFLVGSPRCCLQWSLLVFKLTVEVFHSLTTALTAISSNNVSTYAGHRADAAAWLTRWLTITSPPT